MVIEVPSGRPASSTRIIFPPLISIIVPAASSSARVSRCKRATDAIEGNASPRKPRVAMLSRSSVSLDFRSRMPLECQHGIVAHHAAAIVDDLDQLLPARFDVDANAAGARIQRVLQQLLHHRCRTLHHLARGDLVGNAFRQYVNLPHLVSTGPLLPSYSPVLSMRSPYPTSVDVSVCQRQAVACQHRRRQRKSLHSRCR